jgi:hypothetical protein
MIVKSTWRIGTKIRLSQHDAATLFTLRDFSSLRGVAPMRSGKAFRVSDAV